MSLYNFMGIILRWKKFNYMLEIDIIRSTLQTIWMSWRMISEGLGVQMMARWAKTMITTISIIPACIFRLNLTTASLPQIKIIHFQMYVMNWLLVKEKGTLFDEHESVVMQIGWTLILRVFSVAFSKIDVIETQGRKINKLRKTNSSISY